MDDLISRQPEQRTLTEDDYAYCTECDHVEMCRWYPMYGCEFKSRPSAQPDLQNCLKCIFKPFKQFQTERKKGRWIDLDDHVMCSCCGAAHYGADKNYCPNCGADCRGENNG